MIPFFKCLSCDKYKMKSGKCYEVVIRGKGFTITKLICQKCGDETSDVYERGKQELDE